MIGLLWSEAKGFNEKKAIAAHKRRLLVTPNVVYCREKIECQALIVKLSDTVLPNHYYLVKEDGNVKENEQVAIATLAF